MRFAPVELKLTRIMVLFVMLVLAGCASKPSIQSDYDHSVDFSKFRTYGYFTPLGIEDPNYSSILGSIFRDAIDKEMTSRGYVRSDNPDLLVNVSGKMKDKLRVTNTGGGYYGYRGAYYGPWGGYGFGSTTHVSEYTEGTVNVDLVDRTEKRMVWEAVAIGRVKENKSNEELRASIHSGIQEMFAGFPFRAQQ